MAQANKIGSDFFAASALQDYQAETMVSLTDSVQNQPTDQSAPLETSYSSDLVIAPSESIQDQLDDIQEKLDIISAEVKILVAQQNQNNQLVQVDKDNIDDKKDNQDADPADNNQTENPVVNDTGNTGGGGVGSGSGSSSINYPQILISEVKIAEKTGDKNVFIELYNPNETDVDLSGWYIFRNGSSFITKTQTQGKIITGKNYFLIAKQGSIWDNQTDLSFDETLNDDDEIILKNPSGEQADQVSWSQITSGLSWGRRWDSVNNAEQDFELQTPTPKMQNITYIAPPPVTLTGITITNPANKLVYNTGDDLDITGLVVTGTYSDNSTQAETITTENITGFDSSIPVTDQTVTITVDGKSANYTVNILAMPTNTATQLKIITSPQTVEVGIPSSVFTVESQNSVGQLTDVLLTTYVSLSSNSATGMFSSKSSSECGDDWTKTSINISKGDAHRSFCYKDSAPGIYTITVSATGLFSDSQGITINIADQ